MGLSRESNESIESTESIPSISSIQSILSKTMNLLETITALSHEFGTRQYVKAGGGNTSCKTADTLWVKPSGTTLAKLAPETFVALDRAALSKLYEAAPPADPAAREELVKEMMAAAVKPETPGRASVEAPLHNALAAAYVVHTHPALVNGLTCAVGGRAAAARLFPDALWVPYTDPGYTLCIEVRKAVQAYKAAHGKEPAVLLLENHGIFVAGDTPESIRWEYSRVMNAIRREIEDVGLPGGEDPDGCGEDGLEDDRDGAFFDLDDDDIESFRQLCEEALGADAACIAVCRQEEPPFPVQGPLSPDHIVYAKSYFFNGDLTVENLRAFKEVRGYAPRVIYTEHWLFAVGATQKVADTALELALDGASVRDHAYVFGGVKCLDDRARGFIENWEVESYRSKQV
jgi:rhamnose utilization protein RhaD (predicted bifunctional aldolase and dehydrogenase)